MNQSAAHRDSYEFDVLSMAWSNAGRRLGPAGTHGCVAGDCRSLAYVALKTSTGDRPVCFRHYSLLEHGSQIAE